MTILDQIFEHKRHEVEDRMTRQSLAELERQAASATNQPVDFIGALRQATQENGQPALIAEIKRASPSRGLLLPDFDPLRLAGIYATNGAAAISVLTDEHYFQGHLDHLRDVAEAFPGIPLLRKDFILHAYQVYEARLAGAAAVLLIAAYLETNLLEDLMTLITQLGMAPLVEVHTRQELEAVLPLNPALIGINNRNLHDFSVSLTRTLELSNLIPQTTCLVAESGIHSMNDVQQLAGASIDAILVGEALVTSKDIAARVRELALSERMRQ